MVLKNSVQSLQNLLNDAMSWLEQSPVTASAYSQARYKFKHTAFIALNQNVLVKIMYDDEEYKKFRQFRLLAIDGSKIALPDNSETRNEFGTMTWLNKVKGERAYALSSLMYDVLNHIVVDAKLESIKTYEGDVAISHLEQTRANDLLLMDRGYASYRLLAEIMKYQRDVIIRCSAQSFHLAREMLKGTGPTSQIVTLSPCSRQINAIKKNDLPLSLTVRFVRVQLNSGMYEVLVTTLLDEKLYHPEDFLYLSAQRWGVETFYGIIKTRLELENFTGTGVEAVKQDFYATMLVSNLESILTADSQEQLDKKEIKHLQRINNNVSFHAIKYHLFDLLYSEKSVDEVISRLTELFLLCPTSYRTQRTRSSLRKKLTASQSLHFQKFRKKHCF